MSKYIGITVGPIGDTISEASTPAALWFASRLFSDITRRICMEITREESFSNVQIYSPYYSESIRTDDGVGKFHDRIIFSVDSYDKEVLDNTIARIKRETILGFAEEITTKTEPHRMEAFLEQYLQIHYVVVDECRIQGQNCILALSPYLDALELMKTFPKEHSDNPVRALFQGEENNGNKYIKESRLFKMIKGEMNQLKKSKDSIWTIEDIACDHGKVTEDVKRKRYFAVVQADGDGMGVFLNQLGNSRVTEFSEICLSYAESAAEMIGEYGGMTIYAGGDDLLFLAPVENGKGDTVFSLCYKIQKLFRERIREKESLKDIQNIPTVSFGISIQYVKHPLYEALSHARELLARAKCGITVQGKEEKNNMTIELQKHSGQSFIIQVSNDSYPEFERILELREKYEQEETVTSVIYILKNFQMLIDVMNREVREGRMSQEAYQTAWLNLFDNENQKPAEGYLKGICMEYYENFVKSRAKIRAAEKEDSSLETLLCILRLGKFLIEKGEER